MEFYTKISSSSPAAAVSETKDSLEVNIKSGKKIRACISQALKSLQVYNDICFTTKMSDTNTSKAMDVLLTSVI